MNNPFHGWTRTPAGSYLWVGEGGESIEISASSNGNPPGTEGWGTCKPTIWVRQNGGDWAFSTEPTMGDTLVKALDPKWLDDLFKRG